jgi:hypothetical protein
VLLPSSIACIKVPMPSEMTEAASHHHTLPILSFRSVAAERVWSSESARVHRGRCPLLMRTWGAGHSRRKPLHLTLQHGFPSLCGDVRRINRQQLLLKKL